ncbi:MAG TPA: MMPL family transporter [Candidatus Polarisedimenticolaceae bacterium]
MLTGRAGAILLAAGAVTALALLPASRLTLESDLPSLLPEGSRAADDYRVFLDSFGGLEKVFVLLEAPEGAAPEALGEAAFALADRLSACPEVRSARAGLGDDDERFFLDSIAPNAPLLEPAGRVAAALAPGAVEARIDALRLALASPGGSATASLAAADPLGLAAERLGREGAGSSLPVDPTTGAFLSGDGRAALVIVTPARAETDAAGGRALRVALDAAWDDVRGALPAHVTMRATGGPLYAAHDEEAIRRDLVRVSGGAVLGVGLLIVLVCGGIAIPLAAAAAVGCGLAWTAAAAGFGLGSVTAVGVGFGAILIGMGDDYVNHLGADYRDRVLRGTSRLRATAGALRRAAPGTIASALTTSAAFGVLSLAHFRPLRELGIVVAIGMLLMLASAYLVAAPVLVLTLSRAPRKASLLGRLSGAGWRALGAAVDATVGLARRHPRGTLVTAMVATLVAAPGLARLSLDTDPRRLRPDDHPGVEAAGRLARLFGVGMETTTVVVRAPDLVTALDRAEAVAARLRREVGDRGEVRSPSDWLVAGERLEARRRALAPFDPAGAADRLGASLDRAGFSVAPFAGTIAALRVLGGAPAEPLPPRERWPDWLRDAVREDASGAAVAVHVRHAATLPGWEHGPPEPLVRDLGEAAVASIPRLGADLRRVAMSDLRRLGGIALAIVAGMILLSFRGRPFPAVLALTPAVLGAVWTFGVWGWLGRPIDLFALAVIPILLGLGDDHGLHVVHRAQTVPFEGLAGAAAGSGRAMVLSTLTTCAGFASLLLSAVPGLRDGGALVALGLACGLAAALLVLPAIGALRSEGAEPAPPPHAPEGGRARRWLGRFHVTGVFWFRFHLFGVRHFSWGARVGVPAFTVVFFVALRRIRRAVASNLEAVLGPCGPIERERRIWRTFLSFAWCLTERYENLAGVAKMRFEIEGLEHWTPMADSPGGFVMLTAHVGNWESASMLPASRFDRRVHVVREEELDPRAQEFVRGLLTSRGATPYLTHFATHDTSLGLELVDALRAGDVVALQGDRPRQAGRSIEGTLFGRSFRIPNGVPALARAAGVPLLPVFVLREGRRRYRIVFHEPIRFAPGLSRADSEAAFAARVGANLEAAIRRAPEQWFCFRELWPPS